MPINVFRNRNFRLLWFGTVVSASGFAVGNMVIEWIIYATTHTALLLTLLGIVEFVPMLTIGVFAGALVDRRDRRSLMIMSDIVRACAMAVLAVIVIIMGFNSIAIFGAVVVISIFGAIFDPASSALLPSLVKKENLTDGNGFLQAGETIAKIIGSPLGGILIVLVGIASGFIYNSITFAISAIAIGMLGVPASMQKVRGPEEERHEKLLEEVKTGFRFLLGRRALLAMTVTSMILNFFSFYQIYIVVYALNILHNGPVVFGLLVGGSSIGYAVGAALIGRLHFEKAPGIWVPLMWGLGGLPLIFLILIPVTSISIVSMFFEGFLGGMVNTVWVSVIQRVVPEDFLGRYFSIEGTIGYSMVPAGITFGGFLIALYGVGFAFLLAGISILIIGLTMLTRRNIRSWGREER
ncbi:MAG: MFS transporter [Candidatus Thermoplasmatota archaeon]|jgi:MFS family permease|nr:MFS transporter [Candidatus Thermoplasmatota archaeon]MCL5785862.1 MFS transporter [Candidatus Thermoplasmatota archaeon]